MSYFLHSHLSQFAQIEKRLKPVDVISWSFQFKLFGRVGMTATELLWLQRRPGIFAVRGDNEGSREPPVISNLLDLNFLFEKAVTKLFHFGKDYSCCQKEDRLYEVS